MALGRVLPVRMVNGHLDAILATVLAVMATWPHLHRGELAAGLIDLAACLAAALTARWPKPAGIALGIVLASLLFTPSTWWSMGEYAPLIPILGSGLRGQRRERLIMTIGYGAILAALTIQDIPNDPMVLFALALWATLIAFLWVIGDLFASYRRALEKAHAADAREERLALARELHDTVARELTNTSLRAQALMEDQHLPELQSLVDGIQQASVRLRWVLGLLRDTEVVPDAEATAASLQQIMHDGVKSLRLRGFSVTTSIDGETDHIPRALTPILRAVFGEACANIEHHGDPAHPCVVLASATDDCFDALFLNNVREVEPRSRESCVGLIGLHERLTVVGGELFSGQEGEKWITRVSIPW